MDTPIPEAYWVEPGRLLAGPYPDLGLKESMTARLQALLDAGIQLFIDLTEAGEMTSYADKLGGQAFHLRIPIADFALPSPETMLALLNILDDALYRQLRVYVHCLAGLGRTGTVIGCYLVRHGLKGGQALDWLDTLRANSAYAGSSSPETNAQRTMVLRWPVGQ